MTRRPSAQTAAVLIELADRSTEWSHGYDLCRTLDLKAGTVYPILLRLAERGLVETAWEQGPPQGRPPRHLYRLSRAGAEFAAGLAAAPRGTVTGPAPATRPAPRLRTGTAPA